MYEDIPLSLGIFALEACYFILLILIFSMACKWFMCKVWCYEAPKEEGTDDHLYLEEVEMCSVIRPVTESANDAAFLRNSMYATAAPRRQRLAGRRATPGPIPFPLPTQSFSDIRFSFGFHEDGDYDTCIPYDTVVSNEPCTSQN